jgi:hypothetical protein
MGRILGLDTNTRARLPRPGTVSVSTSVDWRALRCANHVTAAPVRSTSPHTPMTSLARKLSPRVVKWCGFGVLIAFMSLHQEPAHFLQDRRIIAALNGIEAAVQLRDLGVKAKVVFLTMHRDVAYALRRLGNHRKSRLNIRLRRCIANDTV